MLDANDMMVQRMRQNELNRPGGAENGPLLRASLPPPLPTRHPPPTTTHHQHTPRLTPSLLPVPLRFLPPSSFRGHPALGFHAPHAAQRTPRPPPCH